MGNASTFCDKQTNGENYVTEYDDANFSESQKWNEFLVQVWKQDTIQVVIIL